MIHDRRIMRRIDPWQIFWAVVWTAGLTLVVLTYWTDGKSPSVVLSTVAWLADGLILIYLAGPAASIAVTPSRLMINNPYVQHVVPRHLVQDVTAEGHWWTPRLYVAGNRPIRLAVLCLPLPPARLVGEEEAQAVRRLIAEVPYAPSGGEVRRRLRYGHLLLALTAFGTAVASAVHQLNAM